MKTLYTIAFVAFCLLISSPIALTAPASKATSAATAPLTYVNLVSFFKAAKFRVTEVQPRCTIFFEGEWKNANVYDYCVIMV